MNAAELTTTRKALLAIAQMTDNTSVKSHARRMAEICGLLPYAVEDAELTEGLKAEMQDRHDKLDRLTKKLSATQFGH
jgi:hypothetical protein